MSEKSNDFKRHAQKFDPTGATQIILARVILLPCYRNCRKNLNDETDMLDGRS